jgi:hypothetical protein
MSLEFVIIPISKRIEQNAYDIKSKLVNSSKLSVNVEIDLNYELSTNNKLMKWKKKDYNIIIVDEDFIETNTIVVRFSDKGSKPKLINLDDFIDLVSSFEDEDEDEEQTKQTNKTIIEDSNESNCFIM